MVLRHDKHEGSHIYNVRIAWIEKKGRTVALHYIVDGKGTMPSSQGIIEAPSCFDYALTNE